MDKHLYERQFGMSSDSSRLTNKLKWPRCTK